MITRDIRRLALAAAAIILLLYSLAYFHYNLLRHEQPADILKEPVLDLQGISKPLPTSNTKADPSDDDGAHGQKSISTSTAPQPVEENASSSPATDDVKPNSEDVMFSQADADRYHRIFSTTTHDGKFIIIDFGTEHVVNPNILPHPTLDDTWIAVAQQRNDQGNNVFKELACDVSLSKDGTTLSCQAPAIELPILKTNSDDRCEGDLSHFNLNIGPHDARVFHGPQMLYIVFGSNSRMTCFGQFVQAFAGLAGWDGDVIDTSRPFAQASELQRPGAWNQVEKNWFLFWDGNGAMYVHHDIWPKRVFAMALPDASVGPDLAPLAAEADEECMRKYFPEIQSQLESVHQATNSLRIVMCNSTDPGCADTAEAYIFTIYQHKSYYDFHSVYEPYVMVFQEHAPFQIHALSKRPIWIHGREMRPHANTSDMFYVTSISWKEKKNRYSGFLDEDIFIAFGIEDEKAGVINVRASDLLADLGSCL